METIRQTQLRPKADLWFASGERLPFDWRKKQIAIPVNKSKDEDMLGIWNKTVNEQYEPSECISMMPGFPDGSFGWAQTEEFLAKDVSLPRLYVEYVGQGDSDKPDSYPYSTKERADLVEALWKHHGIKSTTLVTFDYSSLVALELLSRQIDRLDQGQQLETRITGFLSINGGLFADAHTHPILTTPLLKTAFGRKGARMAQNSTFVFNTMMKDLWSKEYGVTKDELAEVHNAIGRRNGTVFMSNAARFVDEHKHNSQRWDLQRIYRRLTNEVGFVVVGSKKDQFEYRQVIKAKERLGHIGLETRMLPGGHMTTSEHPDKLAEIIKELVGQKDRILT